MAAMIDWVQLPTGWIQSGGLSQLKWAGGNGADNTAALAVLLVIAHHMDQSGVSRVTYDELEASTGLSRAKLAAGLGVLAALDIVERQALGRSTYRMNGYGVAPWGKLPARPMYNAGRLKGISEFHLRKSPELNALKLFLLAVERRDNRTNMAHMTYETINERSGIPIAQIKPALSLLAVHGLLYVEQLPSRESEYGVSNAYRIPGIDPHRHLGTVGRGLDEYDIADALSSAV